MFVLCRSVIVDIVHKLVRRRKRERAQVASDYDQGEWLDHLRARRWDSAVSLHSYVVPDDRRPIVATVNHRLVQTTVHDYYVYRTRCLSEVLTAHAGDAVGLVEIGSGAGRNLFALALDPKWEYLRGLELSKTGIEVTRLAASSYGLDHVSAVPIDLLDPLSGGFSELQGKTAFSFYCLEQLPDHTESVLTSLAKSGVRRVIHMEPSPELLSFFSLRDLATISYIWRQHYLHDIVAVARRLESRGLIRILAVERLGFAPTVRNAPTLVAWEPVIG